MSASIVGAAAPLAAQSRATIAGKVTSTTGEPLQGATIFVAGTQLGATTRADGSYRVVLPPGAYEIRVRLLGYNAARDSIVVAAGASVTRNFQLQKAPSNLEQVVVVGSRREARTVTEAPVPIDVISPVELKQTGRTETAQIIQMVAPSFNFPRATIGDGTDHVRPSTLRGLNPDQVLVLINGKRRHTSALVNVNGTIGRGSTGVDLNAIPVSAIERIEVLRDGAAAQYGSDAIAGVINIVLKGNVPSELSATLGQSWTTLEDTIVKRNLQLRDGKVLQLGGSHSVSLGTDGYVMLSGEYRNRDFTNRSLEDTRQQFFTGDPRNTDPTLTRQINHRQGDAATRDGGGFVNLLKPLSNGTQLYAFGGLTKRNGTAAGFFRRALDDRTVRAIHPNGFLPLINSDIWDGSGAVGVRGDLGGWTFDASTEYGKNTFGFTITNSNNASMGTASPTEFYAGKLGFGQFTTNLDLARELRVGLPRPVNVALGGEFRRDDYQIHRGDSTSYGNYGVRVLDGPNKGNLTAPGAQVFPGFRPTDEIGVSRNNVAAYLDLETNLTPQLLVGLAGRTERYSDFGGTTTGKATARLEPVKGFAIRGAVGNGFRAPSLGQSYFSATSTNFINGVPFENRTFPVNSPVAKLLGAKPLKPEKSVNYSAGLVLQPMPSLQVTADWYRITIDDRIVFSGNLINARTRGVLQQNGFNVAGARYFTNAVDTRTSGLDLVANYGLSLAGATTLRFSGAYNQNRTRVTRVAPTPPELSGLGEALFDRVERARIEVGQPRNNLHLSAFLNRGPFGLVVHEARFGQVSSFGTDTTGALDNVYGAKWITDVSASYRPLPRVTLTAGVDNAFDVYPDRNRLNTDNFGIFPYSGISPFGFNGRFTYVRLAYGL